MVLKGLVKVQFPRISVFGPISADKECRKFKASRETEEDAQRIKMKLLREESW